MLIVRPIGPRAGGYYLQGPDPGRWTGRGSADLGVEGAPTPLTLGRVLRAAAPESGRALGPARRDRRAGWDLVFAAPKSVSLLAALAPGSGGEAIRSAHERAVGSTLAWIGDEACWARRGGRRVAAGGLVAARFEHTTSAAGDPHLHTHVVLANLVRGPDGAWSALDSSALWQLRRTVGPLYDLALRHEIRQGGLRLRWTLTPDRAADVAGVPRTAIEAASSRRHRVLAVAGAAERDEGGEPVSPQRREAARVRSRTQESGNRDARWARAGEAGWVERVTAAGFGRDDAVLLLGGARRPPPKTPPDPELTAAAARSWLSRRSSTWTRADAVQAVAGTLAAGAAPVAAWRAAADLCAGAEPVTPGRWTTPEARRADLEVVAWARAPGPVRALVAARTLDRVLAAHPTLSTQQRERVRSLVGPGRPVTVVAGLAGAPGFLDQAVVLDAARAAWEAAGHRVTLDAPAGARRRWEALAGLRGEAGKLAPGSGGVVVVDRADRRTSRELAGLLGLAGAAGAKVVLVEGGTAPVLRHPSSAALAGIDHGPSLAAGHPAPGAPSTASTPPGIGVPTVSPTAGRGAPAARPVASVASPRLVVAGSLPDAVDSLLDRWQASPAGRRPLLIGLGSEEISALNVAARARLRSARRIGSEEVQMAGTSFAVGDLVVARRAGPPAAGRLGTVAAIGARQASLTVRWHGGGNPVAVTAHDARRLAHGYAVGPGLATRMPGPALVLGDPGLLGPARGRDITGFVIASTGRRALPLPDRLTELAERMAEDPGRPGAGGGHRRGTAPDPARRPLAELVPDRDRLGRELRTSLPAEGGPAEESWCRANAGPLRRWLTLADAVDRRADLVTHALGADPASPGRRVVGDAPDTARGLRAWQEAARAVAVHADRWPDGPALDPVGRASELRRDRALDDLARVRGRTPGREHHTGLGR